MASSAKLSVYGEIVPPGAKSRYLQYLQLFSGSDPFLSSLFENQAGFLPPVEASEILSYLVLPSILYTTQRSIEYL